MSSAAAVPSPLSKEKLSAQLMECAILVKKGEKSSLIKKTIGDLQEYLGMSSSGHKHHSSSSQKHRKQRSSRSVKDNPRSSPTTRAANR